MVVYADRALGERTADCASLFSIATDALGDGPQLLTLQAHAPTRFFADAPDDPRSEVHGPEIEGRRT